MKKLSADKFAEHGVNALEDAIEQHLDDSPRIVCGLWFQGRNVCPNRKGTCVFTWNGKRGVLQFGVALKNYKCKYSKRKVIANLVRRKDLINYQTKW